MKHMINIFSTDLNTRIPQDHKEETGGITVFDCSLGEGILKQPGSGDSFTMLYLRVTFLVEGALKID